MRLKDKVAIVTGGGSGFGEAMAKRFAEEGAKLVVNDINDTGGRRVVREIEGTQGQGSALYVRADVSRGDDMAALVGASLDRYGHIDIMVNNAGITHVNQPMLDVPEDDIRPHLRGQCEVDLSRDEAPRAGAAPAGQRAARSSISRRPAGCGRGRASSGTTVRRAP